MTGVYDANVGIKKAYFRPDANSSLQIRLDFVGISWGFRHFDTALSSPNADATLASAGIFTNLIQHWPRRVPMAQVHQAYSSSR